MSVRRYRPVLVLLAVAALSLSGLAAVPHAAPTVTVAGNCCAKM